MTECDRCGSTTTHVWRHRAFGSEAHRKIEWICATCHPELPDTVSPESDGDGDRDRVAVTDGGKSTFACPSCAGPTVNGQGLFDCVDCGWYGPCGDESAHVFSSRHPVTVVVGCSDCRPVPALQPDT